MPWLKARYYHFAEVPLPAALLNKKVGGVGTVPLHTERVFARMQIFLLLVKIVGGTAEIKLTVLPSSLLG